MLLAKSKTDFLEYLEIEQGRSQKTLQNYDHYLTRLLDFAGDEIKVEDIDGELIRQWRLWLNRLGTNVSDELGKTTQNYHLIALRSFLKFCSKRNIPAISAQGRPEFKLRVGDHRVLYEFDVKQGRLHLHYVGNRREIYKRS